MEVLIQVCVVACFVSITTVVCVGAIGTVFALVSYIREKK